MAFCSNCGSQSPDDIEYCAQCGNKVSPTASQPPPAYQQPVQGYQQPPPGYQQPPPGYQQPVQGYQQPPPGYQQPPPGYQQPPPGYQMPPQGYQQPRQQGFIGEVYSKAFKLLFEKPIRLWGLSLLYVLLVFLTAVSTALLPILYVAIALVLELGMASIFLNGYRRKDISATQLFEGFNKKFFRNAGGMGWMYLWVIIWGLIPLAGFVMAIIKSLAYGFVPYIMLTEPDISATDALKKSMMQTNGYKGKMFLANFLIGLCTIVLVIILIFIARIPYIGILIAIIGFLIMFALLPLLFGILSAAYYDKVLADNPDRA